VDTMTRAARSALMGKIRGDNLKPELRLAAALDRENLSYERNRKDLPGKPDFVVLGRLAVFAHGCFWHGCRSHFRPPKTRTEHWVSHVAGNKRRDARVRRKLRGLGLKTAVVWEHDLKTEAAADRAAAKIARRLGL
jgi:DNA mismatch endonuclease (patch repair protein)